MTDNKGILIVYNTCTIGWRSNQLYMLSFDQWKIDVDKILSQDIDNCQIVITECRGTESISWDTDPRYIEWQNYLKDHGVYFIIVRDYLPFGQSVNDAVKTIINLKGTYEYYMYWSSGFELKSQSSYGASEEDNAVLSRIYNCLQENVDICRANLFASNDNYPPEGYDHHKISELFTILPGYAINDHCSIYSNEWVESFDNCIRPDIFKGNGSETVFPYMAASIGKRCVILPKQVCPALIHHKNLDGDSNPGIGNRMNKWYVKSLGDEPVYLNETEIQEKRIRLHDANIMMSDDGRIANDDDLTTDMQEYLLYRYGHDGMKLTTDQQKELHKVIKEEFFVSDFDYNKINKELLWT